MQIQQKPKPRGNLQNNWMIIIKKKWGPYIAQCLRVLADLGDAQGLIPCVCIVLMGAYLPAPLENLKIINSKNKRKKCS